MQAPRGIRNNNPGNIRRSSDPWQGLAADQSDSHFFVFRSPEWGIRAMARILVTYQDRHNIRTLRQVIERWSPKIENPTDDYVRHVSERTGIDPDTEIDLSKYLVQRPLIEAIIQFENGQQPYPARVIDRGLELAGIEPDGDPALHRPEGQAGAAVVAGTGGIALVSVIGENIGAAAPFLSVLAEHAPWVIAVTVLGGFAYVAWCRWTDSRNRRA